MLKFDEKGHLVPYEIIETTWEDFTGVFVKGMQNRRHRSKLLENYEAYLLEIRQNVSAAFFQWVNGSFVTQKKLPGDIDMVTFLPYDLMVKNGSFVEQMRRTSKSRFNIDGFFVPVAKWNHRFYESCQREEQRWRTLFGSSREGLPKGIIKLNLQHDKKAK